MSFGSCRLLLCVAGSNVCLRLRSSQQWQEGGGLFRRATVATATKIRRGRLRHEALDMHNKRLLEKKSANQSKKKELDSAIRQGSSVVYLIMAVWLSMHASVTSHSPLTDIKVIQSSPGSLKIVSEPRKPRLRHARPYPIYSFAYTRKLAIKCYLLQRNISPYCHI